MYTFGLPLQAVDGDKEPTLFVLTHSSVGHPIGGFDLDQQNKELHILILYIVLHKMSMINVCSMDLLCGLM